MMSFENEHRDTEYLESDYGKGGSIEGDEVTLGRAR